MRMLPVVLCLCIASMACSNCSKSGVGTDVSSDGDAEPSIHDSIDGESVDGKDVESDPTLNDTGDLRDIGGPDDASLDAMEEVEEEYHSECVYLDYPAMDLGTLTPTPFATSRAGMDCGERCRQASIVDDDIISADYDVWGNWLVLSSARTASGEIIYSRIYMINLEDLSHTYISSDDVDNIYPHSFDDNSALRYVSVFQDSLAFIWFSINADASEERFDIFLFDLNTNHVTMQKTSTYYCPYSSCSLRDVDLFGNFIAYNDIRETLHEQNFILNLDTREECLISVTGCCTVRPKIYGGNVAFCEGTSGDGVNVYLYDIDTKTTTRLIEGRGDHYSPQIWEDIVVWTDTRNGGTSMSQENADVFMMNLTTGVETPVCTNPAAQPHPAAIWGTKVAWPDCRNDPDYPNVPSRALNWDLYMYDISTEVETQLTSMPGDESSPKIYENKVYFIMKDAANIYSVFEIIVE